MGSKHRTLFIDANTIKATFSKPLTGPFLDCVTSSVPHLGFQYTTSSLKIQIVYGNNFRRAFPMVDISVSFEAKTQDGRMNCGSGIGVDWSGFGMRLITG